MFQHEVNQNGCHISCFERDMGWGIKFGMNVNFPHWFTKEWKEENQSLIRKVAQYTANKLEWLVLTDAVTFFKQLSVYGFQTEDKDGVWIFYEGGKSAFIHPFIYQNKMDIDSYVTFNSVNEHGFTLTPGSFSDFIISERSSGDEFFGYTKDFLPVHFGFASLYLLNFCENLENIIMKKEIPSDFGEFAVYDYVKMSAKGQELVRAIQNTINTQCSYNKSKRIDTLIVSNKSIYDLMHEYNIAYSFDVRGVTLLKVALALGKTPTQVEQFLKKYIDKKRVSSVLPISY